MLEFRPDRAFDSLTPLESIRDVPYGPLTDKAQLLDILRPRATTDSPRAAVVIHIHGGGWTQYGKHLEDCVFLAEAGFCTISINYRYAQDAAFPAQLEDAISALRWVRGSAAELSIDPTRVYVWGISAGGHIAAMLGRQAELHLRGVGAICAPSDLTDQTAWQLEYADPHGGFQTLLGTRGDVQPALAARASPALQVSSHDGQPPSSGRDSHSWRRLDAVRQALGRLRFFSRSWLLHHQHQLPLRARRGVSRAARGRDLGIALGARFSG